ncbi:hypothetical protein TNCV_4155741 [Trichonephila clavipes]|nr:hypothetical protein TNCV_4155741 [Trichonephila clavipes]
MPIPRGYLLRIEVLMLKFSRVSLQWVDINDYSATRGLLATDLVILNHKTPELVKVMTPEVPCPSPNYHTRPMGGRLSSRHI